jgi:copper chaperone
MKVMKFKTNVDREDAISSLFDNEETISKWKLDFERPDHLLSVSGNEIDPQIIKDLVKKAGYEAELIRVIGIGGEDI